MCALIPVCSHMCAPMFSHMCALTCLLLYACSYVSSFACSHLCAAMCSHMCAPVRSYVCSLFCFMILCPLPKSNPRHCLGSLAGIILGIQTVWRHPVLWSNCNPMGRRQKSEATGHASGVPQLGLATHGGVPQSPNPTLWPGSNAWTRAMVENAEKKKQESLTTDFTY